MIGLSLSPRYDLFRFCLPKTFLPESVTEKYQKLINRESSVLYTPIDYLNESIQGIRIPGLSDMLTEQQQREKNRDIIPSNKSENKLGRIAVEPAHTVVYTAATNPLDKIEKEFKVTFRMNQGLYNYYMLYETIFHHYKRDINLPDDAVLYAEILNDYGEVCGRIKFIDTHIDGIDGLDLSYDKTTRETNTFDITFKFNNIDFEFIPNHEGGNT